MICEVECCRMVSRAQDEQEESFHFKTGQGACFSPCDPSCALPLALFTHEGGVDEGKE